MISRPAPIPDVPPLSTAFRVTVALALLAVIARCWLNPLPSGLALDETGTLYMVSGDWSQFLDRMARTIQSPLYCTFLWLWTRAAGLSEVALRIPSVLALLGTAFVVGRIAVRLAGESAGLIAALLLCSTPTVVYLGVPARPYAFAMLAASLLMLAFLDWADRPSLAGAVRCAFAAALLLWIHPLTFALLPALVWTAGVQGIRRTTPRQILTFCAVTALLVLPVCPYYLKAFREAAAYEHLAEPAFADLAAIFGNSLLPGSILLGLLAASATRPQESHRSPLHPLTMPLLVAWAILPPLILFVWSRLHTNLFAVKYCAAALPAVPILLAVALSRLANGRAQLVTALSCALGGALSLWSTAPYPKLGEWRDIRDVVERHSGPKAPPVLLSSGFVEANTPQRLSDPAYREFIVAPLIAYPVRGAVHALPYDPSRALGEYAERVIASATQGETRFFVVAPLHVREWAKSRLEGGWTSAELHPMVTEFRRRIPPR